MYACGRVLCTSQFTAKDNTGRSSQNIPFPQVLLSPACVPCVVKEDSEAEPL